jgi:hypothetical protein
MGHPVQEEDKVQSGKIILIGVVSVATFIVGSLWAGQIEKRETLPAPSEQRPAALAGKPEVGIVYQTQFREARFGLDLRDKKEAWLDSYGWVDSEHKVVHIPIEQAMERVAQSAGASK